MGPQVAIIDDDASLCRSLSRLLRLAGYQPCTFHSAEEFLGDPSRARFGCLLVDIQLGGMSGLEMQRVLAAEGQCAPLIFITAHDGPSIRTQAVQAGCAGFFSKTDEGARILDAIRDAVRP
ncbi:MAG TPA: response regulator [Burkholderiales bacterium]|nr:response regulator [Burkholderiales bacterium]